MENNKHLSREDVAREEIGRTRVSPGVSLLLSSLLVATLWVVPVLQQVSDVSKFKRGARATWVPECFSILKGLPDSWDVFCRTGGSLPNRAVAADRHMLREMRHYEKTQEESSWLGQALLPWAQWGLTRWLRVGNEKVYLGVEGWLFYRPDVDYLTGPGFLGESHAARRLKSTEEWDQEPHPDPVRAIADFAGQLRTNGIHLVVMPTPMKPMIHPEKLSPAFRNPGTAVQNPSFAAFMERLREKGVDVFDCAGLLAQDFRSSGQPQYLVGDTHWRPEAMGRVAKELAAVLKRSGDLPSIGAVEYRQQPVNLSSVGDIRKMLKLPRSRGSVDLEAVQIRQILSPDGELWSADRKADVLVLGDSFSTIFSMPSMGWGEAAGFAEQLAFYLQRPVDRIAQNDNGAFATREALLRETTTGGDRLKGKRLVVWQFAARELAFGDWKVFRVAHDTNRIAEDVRPHSTVTLLARLRGWSIGQPRILATW